MSAQRTKSKKTKKRTHRYTSNVFSMFNQAQIQEFKEAFNMIDQNRDGFIDKDDLIEMLTSLGKNPEDQLLDAMINEAPGAINFTMFLTLFGEKLNGTDPEEVIKNAFGCFDDKDMVAEFVVGVIGQDYLREIMTTMGDRWKDEMVDELFYGAPIKEGLFDYIEFTRMLKHGARDKDDEPIEPPKTPLTPTSQGGGGGSGSSAPGKFVFQTATNASTPGVTKFTAPREDIKAAAPEPMQTEPEPAKAAAKPQPAWKKPKAKSPPPPQQPTAAGATSPPAQGVKPSWKGNKSPKPTLPAGGKPEFPVIKPSNVKK